MTKKTRLALEKTCELMGRASGKKVTWQRFIEEDTGKKMIRFVYEDGTPLKMAIKK